jgi:alkylation response protein AidB-like acyl-CoA dehydrogenase
VQFGRPIGAFQFVQMRAVEGLIDLATYRMLQREAVRAFEAGEDAVLPAEVAVTYAAMRATDVQLAAQHTLAATGYFEEHEAPWLFRRVHADVTRLPEYRLAIGEVADVLLETDRTLTGPVLGDRAEALRSELAAFAADIPIDCSVGGIQRDEVFVYALAERGYLSMSWPPEWGGRDASVTERVVLGEELSYRRAPGSRQRAAADIVGTALLRFGTKQQKERYLPLIAAGRFPFYLGYSEPEAGSDLASLRCRAEPDGDGWVINGVKMWGTGAHDAEWVWLAARTDPDARPAHAGITVFLFSTSTPGWGKQEHRALSGEVSCSTFFDDVRIGPDAVVGEVNDGWRIITAALADERVLMAGLTAGVRRSFDDLLARLRADGALAGPRGSVTRRTLSELAVRMQGARLLVDAGLRAAGGDAADARMYVPMAKIVAGELAEDFGEAALRILSTAGALGSDMFERGLRESIVQVVGGGTGDIQRTILARAMGLPR